MILFPESICGQRLTWIPTALLLFEGPGVSHVSPILGDSKLESKRDDLPNCLPCHRLNLFLWCKLHLPTAASWIADPPHHRGATRLPVRAGV